MEHRTWQEQREDFLDAQCDLLERFLKMKHTYNELLSIAQNFGPPWFYGADKTSRYAVVKVSSYDVVLMLYIDETDTAREIMTWLLTEVQDKGLIEEIPEVHLADSCGWIYAQKDEIILRVVYEESKRCRLVPTGEMRPVMKLECD